MLLCCGKGDLMGKSEKQLQAERDHSKVINQAIKQDLEEITAGKHIRLLLLGTGDSGKSTFVKQMKVIHLNGFKKAEVERFKVVIKESTLLSIKVLIMKSQELNIKLSSQVQESKEIVFNADSLNPDVGAHITRLWADKGIRKTWERNSEFQIENSADYFLDHVSRICQEDYQPTQDDIFRARLKTTGIFEVQFKHNGYDFTLLDAGGQRAERRKWLHCFEDVTAIIYFVALNEYDMKLYEDQRVNRMKESLELFQEITSSRWFKNTPFILFLNKSDLFKTKIQTSPLENLFPNYTGGSDFEKGTEFIKDRFKETFKGELMYTYVTCSLNTENIKSVFDSVTEIVTKQASPSLGM
eukprot:TRINITY_DN1912_c0_g1_i1.p1 TRINITY_DN1912_c0_g1~~TRINITY_DN1912_c0_g1_i1.p1  ORF type:complete len:355 (+),score=75.58 TRINITY_DN1912_c0_g1_i1:3-1067(+)